MSRAGFYNDNALRSYPLVRKDGGLPLPDAALVDFGCVVGPGSGFESGMHSVWLYRVKRGDGDYVFEFRSDAPGLAGRSLVFRFDEGAAEYATRFAEDDTASGSVSAVPADDCDDAPLWEGYLAVGQLAALADVLAESEEWFDHGNQTPVEPALVTNLDRRAVLAFSLANGPRTVTDPPDGCSGSSAGRPDNPVVVHRCLTGDVLVQEGYNCDIRVDANDSAVTIGARPGGGAGQPCDEVPIHDDEGSPDGGLLLTGGPRCDQVLKSINGVGGRVLRLVPGRGVSILPGEAPFTIVVEVDLHGMAVCAVSSVGG